MSEANKAVAKRWTEEIWNKGNMAAIAELVAADMVFHLGDRDTHGHAGLKELAEELRAAFPGGRFTNAEQIAEGDRVVQRWTFQGTQDGTFAGYEAKGKTVSFTGATILRIAGGKVAEHWGYWHQLGWLRQIGKAP